MGNEVHLKQEPLINEKFLDEHPQFIFVFGDNIIRKGKRGGAVLRDHPQAYGFITKKYPNNKDSSFYKPEEYKEVFQKELKKLIGIILSNPDKIFLISKLGSGLANKYFIYENIIEHGLLGLNIYPNVRLLFS